MNAPHHDIQQAMGLDSSRSAAVGKPESSQLPGQVPLDPGQFSSCFEPLRGTLWLIAAGVLGGRGGKHDAEDVVQEAAVIGLRKLGEFQPSTSFSAWMGQIVRNVARNHARKNTRRRTLATDPTDLERAGSSPHPLPSSDLPDPELDQHVLDALDELDEVARTCLLLRTVREMPYRDISTVLEIPEGTAMSHVHRARKALRNRLGAEEPAKVRRPR